MSSVFIASADILTYAKSAEDAYTEDNNTIEFGGHQFKCSYDEITKTVAIAIRGSVSPQEWFLNAAMPFAMLLSYAFVEKDRKLLTSVFSSSDSVCYVLIASRIVNFALERHPDATGFDICGHSRGGLLSIYCGILLVKKPFARVRVFSFGAPELLYSSKDATAKLLSESLKTLQSGLVFIRHERDFVGGIADTARRIAASDHLDQSLSKHETIVLKNTIVDSPHSMRTYVTGIEEMIQTRKSNATGLVNFCLEKIGVNLSEEVLNICVGVVELASDSLKLRGTDNEF